MVKEAWGVYLTPSHLPELNTHAVAQTTSCNKYMNGGPRGPSPSGVITFWYQSVPANLASIINKQSKPSSVDLRPSVFFFAVSHDL